MIIVNDYTFVQKVFVPGFCQKATQLQNLYLEMLYKFKTMILVQRIFIFFIVAHIVGFFYLLLQH